MIRSFGEGSHERGKRSVRESERLWFKGGEETIESGERGRRLLEGERKTLHDLTARFILK